MMTAIHVLGVLVLVLAITGIAVTFSTLYLLRHRSVLFWKQGGLSGEVRLAHCVHCPRKIVQCLHDRGAGETWEHYDDSTHYHFDESGRPTVPVEHR